MDKLEMHTRDLTEENFQKLAALFPNAVTETAGENGEVVRAIDADVLRQEISAEVVEGVKERYQFNWPDKKKSVVLANQPIAKTLRLSREKSVGRDGTAGSIDTENIYIEGDNLDALKLLQETYLGQVKMIYIDPPYNTGNNLIYKNNFSQSVDEYILNSGQFDDDGNQMVQNLEGNGRFHTDWLNMIYPRLRIARDLLAEDGVFVCAIDENEVDTLFMILKNIFGLKREYGIVSVMHNPRGQQSNNVSYVHENMFIIYPKDGKKYIADFPKDVVDARNLRDSGTESDRTDARNCFYPFIVKNGKIVSIGDVPKDSFHPHTANVVREDGSIEVWPISESGDEKKWRYARPSVEEIQDKLVVKKGRSSIQIIYNKDTGTMRSIWANARYDASEYGTKLIADLFGINYNVFSFPKSLWTVYDIMLGVTKFSPDAIVLDFFSGSATTAQAVMQINAKDGGNRKFIMVQIPENFDTTMTTATGNRQKIIRNAIKYLDKLKKPHFLTEIGEERIRRAAKKIKEETNADIDYGFRVFKVDSSNMKDVYYRPQDLKQEEIALLADNIKEDRTPEDLLFQVMLDLGVLLSSKIEEKDIAGKKVFTVEDGYLIACFDKDVTEEVVTAIAKEKPFYAVFRDSGMATDALMANFEQIFETHSPQTVRKVL